MTKKFNFQTVIYILILILFLNLSILLFIKGKKITQKLPTQGAGQARIGLITEQKNSIIFPQPIEIYLTLSKDKNNFDVVGFDAIINYDATILKADSIQSLIPEYDLYINKQPNYLVLTGLKKPSAKQSSSLLQQNIIKIVFQPIKIGKTTIKLVKNLNKDRAKIINEKSQNVLDFVEKKADISIDKR